LSLVLLLILFVVLVVLWVINLLSCNPNHFCPP
jgi:hypothetical protein